MITKRTAPPALLTLGGLFFIRTKRTEGPMIDTTTNTPPPRQTRNHVALEIGFWRQGPIRRLKVILEDHAAGAYVAQLREFLFLEETLDGVFKATVQEVAWASEYSGEPKKFVEALRHVGILKRGRARDTWRYVGWAESITGRYQLTKARNAARQREYRKTELETLGAQKQAENTENLGENAETQKSYKGPNVRARAEHVRSNRTELNTTHTHPLTPSSGASIKLEPPPGGVATESPEGCVRSALWAWLWETYPKAAAELKCRALFEALDSENLEVLREHVQNDILKRQLRYVPELLNYLVDQRWWRTKKPAQKAPQKTKPAIEKAPRVAEDQHSIDAAKDAADQAMFKLREQGKRAGLRGEALDQWVQEAFQTQSRN